MEAIWVVRNSAGSAETENGKKRKTRESRIAECARPMGEREEKRFFFKFPFCWEGKMAGKNTRVYQVIIFTETGSAYSRQ
jgi:hypothetical protein